MAVPNVVGHGLSSAYELLVAMGFDVAIEDERDRSVVFKTNWKVVSQEPLAGSRTEVVTLQVQKYSD